MSAADKVFELGLFRIQSLVAVGLAVGLVRVCDLVCSDGCKASCVFVCVCAFRSVTLTLITTAAFTPQSKEELKDAVTQC